MGQRHESCLLGAGLPDLAESLARAGSRGQADIEEDDGAQVRQERPPEHPSSHRLKEQQKGCTESRNQGREN